MLKQQAQTFNGITRAIDVTLIAVSFAGAATVCEPLNHIKPLSWVPGVSDSDPTGASYQYALLFFASLITWLAVAQWRGTYLSHRAERYPLVLRHEIVTQFLWAIATGACVFLLKLVLISRAFFLGFLPLSMLLLNARQTSAWILLRFIRLRGFNLRSVAIFGDPELVARFAELIRRDATTGYRLVNQPSTNGNAMSEPSETDYDEAFIMIGNGLPNLEQFVLNLVKHGKRVHLVPGMFDVTLFRQSLSHLAGLPVLSLGGYGLTQLQAMAKRFVDMVGSAVLILIFGPVLAVVAFLVKASSPGPILFTQERLGEGGRRFRIYKFRTMCHNAEAALQADSVLRQKYVSNNYKLPKGEDPRITPLGRLLRSTSLDELPQLFNVLKGDMSLVGPRPIVPPEIDLYGDFGSLFMSVKPGLTGNWQVNGRSELRDYSRRAILDIEYIRDQSLKTDVDILLRTIPAVLRRKGAH
ncbi:MAG TPA: sugar transferase [Candidatus Binataceae bacterium]|nr:sugar transferase [Candidatus Binataceae bacterium]